MPTTLTRLLLGQMHRLRSFLAQAAVLVFDLLVSGAIIWAAILVYVASPLHEGEIESFAEILGVFSIFSVMFYSTFLTSVGTWAYILSTWIMRLFTRLRLAHLLDVENKPIRILASVLALVVFGGALGLAVPMQKDADGLTAADRTLCSLFKGPVCLDVAALTPAEQAKLELITPILAECRGALTMVCLGDRLAGLKFDPALAGRLFRMGCDGGHAYSCTNLGYLHEKGVGVAPDAAEAARFFRLGCEGGNGRGCTNLGILHQQGIGVATDAAEAARLYQLGCERGEARGCFSLGYSREKGVGVAADPTEAARLYRLACDGGEARGCTNLGYLHAHGIGTAADPAEAARLYRLGCDGGNALGCSNLGYLNENGIGMTADPVEAVRLYRLGCEMGDEDACAWVEGTSGE